MILETYEDLEKWCEEIKSKGYTLHHESWCSGYLSRTIQGTVSPYKGQFGKGFVLELPCRTSTRYHYKQYYTKES